MVEFLQNYGTFILNIILLVFILVRILRKPLKNMMHKRTQKVTDSLTVAKEEMESAAELKLQYEEQLKGINAERASILEAAKKAAVETDKQIMAEAKKDAEDLVARAKINVKLEEERAREELRLHIINVSSAVSERFLVQYINEGDRNKLFDETITELEEMAWQI